MHSHIMYGDLKTRYAQKNSNIPATRVSARIAEYIRHRIPHIHNFYFGDACSLCDSVFKSTGEDNLEFNERDVNILDNNSDRFRLPYEECIFEYDLQGSSGTSITCNTKTVATIQGKPPSHIAFYLKELTPELIYVICMNYSFGHYSKRDIWMISPVSYIMTTGKTFELSGINNVNIEEIRKKLPFIKGVRHIADDTFITDLLNCGSCRYLANQRLISIFYSFIKGSAIHDAADNLSDACSSLIESDQISRFSIWSSLFLLSMKNVKHREEKLDKILPLRHRSDKLPKNSYKILVVKARTGALEPIVRTSQGDGKNPLHSVQGHHRIYTKERPLMGMHVGTYWFSSHVRGDKKNGTVEKDYSVKLPEVA